MDPETVSVGEEDVDGTENRKGAETNSGESGARNMEAESFF